MAPSTALVALASPMPIDLSSRVCTQCSLPSSLSARLSPSLWAGLLWAATTLGSSPSFAIPRRLFPAPANRLTCCHQSFHPSQLDRYLHQAIIPRSFPHTLQVVDGLVVALAPPGFEYEGVQVPIARATLTVWSRFFQSQWSVDSSNVHLGLTGDVMQWHQVSQHQRADALRTQTHLLSDH